MFGLFSRDESELTLIMREILSLHRVWTEKMLDLEAERVRLERLRVEGVQSADVAFGQLRVSEEEQDADWALKHGVISPDEYKGLLEESGLLPTDIEFIS